jgi:hypothetical protein
LKKKEVAATIKKMNKTPRARKPISETFTFTAQVCGGSCHIRIPRFWLGRTLEVKIKEVKEE